MGLTLAFLFNERNKTEHLEVIYKIERALVLIKPDAFKKGLTGEIISRFERAGLKLEEMKLIKPTKEIAKKHYPNNVYWLRSAGNKT